MTVTDTDTDKEANAAPAPGEDAEWIKKLRADADEAKQLRAENVQLRRTAAMDELGVPKTGAGKLFRDKYDGDPADLDAMKAAAAEYELIPTGTADQEQQSAAVDAAERAASLTDGTTAAQPTVEALLGEAQTMDEIERIAHDAGIGTSIT